MKDFEKDMFWDYTQENDYNYGILNTCSFTDCTGLIPSAPATDDEFEAYNDIYRFRHQDIPAKEDTLKNPVSKTQ